MRIRSGGPSQTAQTQGSGAAKGVGKAQSTKFSGLVEGTKDATDDKGQGGQRNKMLEALAAIAREVEDGSMTKEEASRRFVGIIIQERFGKQIGKGAQKMEESIANMVENDPNFVARLHSQLKKIAKS